MSVRELTDRPAADGAVLSALAERGADGMTVLELRAAVDADIDEVEDALTRLSADGLIDVEERGQRVVIVPDDSVLATPDDGADERSVFDEVRDRLGL